MDLPRNDRRLFNLTKINVLIGKNGCGKSTILRTIDAQQSPEYGLVKYITPERGGDLVYDGNIDSRLGANPNWLKDTRRRNSQSDFRQTSVSEFRRLETLVLRTIEKDKSVRLSDFTFEETVAQINGLLDNIKLYRASDAGFKVKGSRESDYRREMHTLSSGEAELISLAAEILSFVYQVNSSFRSHQENILLIDEPDVHLHPDLQHRLIQLMVAAIGECPLTVIMATHSTAILAALADVEGASVGFMKARDDNVEFRPITETLRHILPIFGAHPLSEVFNRRPILLVEGEDDERVWQQAGRSSQGRLRVWPCAAGDKQSLARYEDYIEQIAGAIYDKPKVYSLRDRDEDPYEIDDKSIVKRARLNCRSAENLILSDDVLAMMGIDWSAMQNAMIAWIDNNTTHKQWHDMNRFRNSGFDRQNADIKSLRNLLMERAGSTKPWEVIVGQTIACTMFQHAMESEHGIMHYLGGKLVGLLRN